METLNWKPFETGRGVYPHITRCDGRCSTQAWPRGLTHQFSTFYPNPARLLSYCPVTHDPWDLKTYPSPPTWGPLAKGAEVCSVCFWWLFGPWGLSSLYCFSCSFHRYISYRKIRIISHRGVVGMEGSYLLFGLGSHYILWEASFTTSLHTICEHFLKMCTEKHCK